jgi:hypothetical protein
MKHCGIDLHGNNNWRVILDDGDRVVAGPVALKIRRMGYKLEEKQLEQVFASMRTVMAEKRFATDEGLEVTVHEVLGKKL